MKEFEVLTKIKEEGICAIIRKVSIEEAVKISKALLEGGVSVVEVAFNTPHAAEIIKAIKNELGEQITIGAGTVLDTETARIAILAGANFVLSPTLHEEVIRMCQKYNVLAVPGVYTPTEFIKAWEAGAKLVKLFPAVTATPAFVKQVMGPLDQIDVMAVGGITIKNAAEFMAAGVSCVGIGSEIAGLNIVQNEGYEGITKKAEEFKQVTMQTKVGAVSV